MAAELTITLSQRLAMQNAVFQSEHSQQLAASPETRTANGDFSENGKLDDRGGGRIRTDAKSDVRLLKRLASIDTSGFPEEDRISHDLMLRDLDQRIRDIDLKLFEMPLSALDGVQTQLAALAETMPFDSIRHYQDYVQRLKGIPRALAQSTRELRRGVRDGLVPYRSAVEDVPLQVDKIVKDDPFLGPTQHFPKSFSKQDRLRLSLQIQAEAQKDVLPAFRKFSTFLKVTYIPHSRSTIGEASLPNGRAIYQNDIRKQTTTDMTPEAIHSLGLSEIDRIDSLLEIVAHTAGYSDIASYRAALNANPRYRPTSAAEIVADYRRYVGLMAPNLPLLFQDVPVTRMTVEAMPVTERPNITHHVDGSADGKVAGRILVATADYTHRSLIGDETVAYHEGLPGHELQVSIAQRLKGLPAFRSDLRNNAYVEGWAVYAEALGKEVGLFTEPASDYGRLNTELLRAVRLVVDTGIHAQGWSQDQAIAFFRGSGAADEPTIKAEIDRAIRWPAQGLSYKIGQLEILKLRDRSARALGCGFDVREFHDEVLGSGSIPLDVLDSKIDRWIAAKQIRAESRSIRQENTMNQPASCPR